MITTRIGIAALAIAVATGLASAQLTKPRNKPPRPPTGTTGPTGPANAPMSDSDIVTRTDEHAWILTMDLTIRVDQFAKDSHGMPLATGMKFETASVIFPVLAETASSLTNPVMPTGGGEPGVRYAMGKLMLNDVVSDEQPTFLPDYACGARLGKWVARDFTGQEVSLQVVLPVTCYQTSFDESAARTIAWPEKWPEPALSALGPQAFVDADGEKKPYDMQPVKEFVADVLRGKDPKSMPPALLAKVLAGAVLERVQPSGNGLAFNRTGELQGVALKGAPQTILDGKGSEHDVACVLVAVYRAAGLPARTVIGWDLKAKTGGMISGNKRGSGELRSWVEFPLINPKDNKLVWVPVDVVRMRKNGTRAKPIDQRWSYFGDHDELDRVVPFAFQFHPPTTVIAYGSPAFWGWLVTPKPPERVTQAIRFTAITAPITAEDQRRKQEEQRKKREEKR